MADKTYCLDKYARQFIARYWWYTQDLCDIAGPRDECICRARSFIESFAYISREIEARRDEEKTMIANFSRMTL